jgi:peptidoglycan/LPS O-acetylase OafA/YrhL
LRGIAVLAVVLYHLSDYCPVGPLKSLLRAGWCGVDLFFVLSGFLITGILLDTQQAPNYFLRFFARRVLRIFPVYYLTLTVVLLAARFVPVFDSVLPSQHDRLFYFVFLNNWWGLLHDTWHANIIGHFWSLAVEEQFYLVWPFIVWRLSPRLVATVSLAGICLAPVIRFAVYAHWGLIRDIFENPFCRMDSLLMGAFLASLVRHPGALALWQSKIYCFAGIAAAALLGSRVFPWPVLQIPRSPLFVFSFLSFVGGGIVLRAFVAQGSLPSVLTACGRYSYGMYVYHVPFIWLLGRSSAPDGLPGFLLLVLVALCSTFVVAKLSYDYFEAKMLRFYGHERNSGI